ncbi:hypothetical protein WA026_001884 [Henosepilachna vigintioctopunctata]|uniref:Uncharacterized protein n=1 Tax=Henosepilachna vigintioctopunctata TaxID=420089 RepID=A0AAW1UUN0_9CUCU
MAKYMEKILSELMQVDADLMKETLRKLIRKITEVIAGTNSSIPIVVALIGCFTEVIALRKSVQETSSAQQQMGAPRTREIQHLDLEKDTGIGIRFKC